MSSNPETKNSKKLTILVVEDNEMNREILIDLLSDEYEVLEADNGLTGLAAMEAHADELSAILLDVYMPECSGFEFLERKRRNPRYDSLPVIVMTASSTVTDEIRCLQLGASDFISKPYNTEVMKNRIQSIIRLRSASSMLNRLERDKLTGLYSKEFFFEGVKAELAAHLDDAYDIVVSDVENFRRVIDRYGEERCDAFLATLAERITSALPDMILGGRIDYDVFAFLIRHQDEDWTASLDAVVETGMLGASVKYGIMTCIDPHLPVSTLCDRAGMALNKIRGQFNARVAWYNEELLKNQLRDHIIVEGMQDAIKRHEFQVYYQPKHNVRENRTGGAEALVRWTHPVLGFISPGIFIPLFERNGFITSLDRYIMEEVCIELKRCKEIGLPLVPISVNLSRMNFDNPNLPKEIAALTDKYGVEHSLVHIELTESAAGDDPKSVAVLLRQMHDMGFVIELDDFGSGYSALASLFTLSLDVMKMDMSIIRHAAQASNYSLARYAIMLAECMKLKTVAEGVETADQAMALKVLGCDYIQGNFFSKPLPREQFEKYLVEGPKNALAI